MSVVRWSVMLSLLLAFMSASVQSQVSLERTKVLLFDETGTPRIYPSKPANEFLSGKEFRDYSLALERFDCDLASRILSVAFVRENPSFRPPASAPSCPGGSECHNWSGFIRLRFPEYGFCAAVVGLNSIEAEIRAQNIVPPKYKKAPEWWIETQYDNDLIESRDYKLAVLISLARNDHKPALLKLADLVRRGDVFNVGGDVEYFLRVKACSGEDVCPGQEARLADLRQQLGGQRAADLDTKARAVPLAYNELHKIMLGGGI